MDFKILLLVYKALYKDLLLCSDPSGHLALVYSVLQESEPNKVKQLLLSILLNRLLEHLRSAQLNHGFKHLFAFVLSNVLFHCMSTVLNHFERGAKADKFPKD